MGEVWVGEHQRLDRQAAVKVLLPAWTSDEGVLERFFIEAKATSRIRHLGIVEIVDCGVTPSGRAYIVMELLEGKNLRQSIAEVSRAPLAFIVSIGRQVASAVGAAHAQKIVHRDLKPDNIFLVEEDDKGIPGVRAKVLDFGIAKLVDREADMRLTGTGILVGTPAYMSPEQARGRGTIDQRTDIYSLGCILFEMAAGRPPFLYEGFGELIAARLMEDPPRLSSVVPGVPEALDDLVNRMLARDPQARVGTMAEVESELKAIAASGVEFISAPALAVVGHTAILTPAGEARSSSAHRHRAVTPTTFTDAAGEVVSQKHVGGRQRMVAAVAVAAVLGAGLFFVTRPASQPQTVAPAAARAPVRVAPVLPPHKTESPPNEPHPPAPTEAPSVKVAPAPAASPAQEQPGARHVRHTHATAPPAKADLNALQDVQVREPKRPARRRLRNRDATERPADLDALAE